MICVHDGSEGSYGCVLFCEAQEACAKSSRVSRSMHQLPAAVMESTHSLIAGHAGEHMD